MKRIIKASLALAILSIISACTTQKSRSDMSALGELYHNTTAHYNGYFNAEELLAASIESLNQQHQDNYTKLLPMYEYVAAENPQSEAPGLDEAIKKVTVVVNLHRYSKWTDDCYLLVGKAQYLKQDYEAAEETFRYMVSEYSPEKMKEREKVSKQDKKVKKKKKKKKSRRGKKGKKKGKSTKLDKEKERALKQYKKAVKKAKKKGAKAPPRPDILKRKSEAEEQAEEKMAAAEEKKEEEAKEDKPDNDDGLLKHRPAYQEGLLWLARTMIERDNYDAAIAYMAELENDRNTYSGIRGQLEAVKAYYHIHRQDYVQALPALENAIESEKDKNQRARYAFIMAQIFQMNGNATGAYASFQQALKLKPGYEMEFNCKLNMAQNAWASGSGSAYEARENLAKLLKDPKNADYKDQIYFALAQIALKNGERDEAITNLELSLLHSRQNQAQRAESYLTLADLYYEAEDYVPAKNYYDSTLQVLTATDSRYLRVQNLSSNLTEIAANIQVIELQDSLLRISRMSESEREELAMSIKKEQDELRRQQIAAKAGAAAGLPATPRRAIGGAGALQQESSFFAYDDRALKRGRREFERKWDNRPLEDNWRRSSRRDASAFEQAAEEEFASRSSDVLTEEEVSKLLGNVPKTEGEIAAANLKIQEAMYNLGSLYRERLQNLPKAIEMFETLDRRYPSNNYELDSWYQLYIIYNGMGNKPRAEEYANKILEKYQNSKYAMVIRNPAYAEELAQENRLLNEYYDATYSAFTTGNYRVAYDKSVSAKEKFGAANPYQPKFALLAAMSTGSLEGKEAYVSALQEVIARYPDTDEQRRAREILRLLGESAASLPGGAKEEIEQFKVEDDALHYVIVVFKNNESDLNKNKVTVSDYNEKYHKLDRLRISNIYLGTDADSRLPILVLRRFKDKAEAMKYYTGVQKNQSDFIPSAEGYELFPVTQNNYREILKEKSVENYRAFFQLNYLK
ncbi:MAG: tetratricopeptide repeat protein [Lewinellaceae bacterium]|nr:tetratricopeptide repeat protein [Phaeodactylibacter sp.]MCB9037393.1 tetratricopeptide repeat protein [Lewinellaceae bacterium]